MKSGVRLETAILVTKLAITPIACWPLPVDATPFDIWRRNIFWGFSIINLTVCIIPSGYMIYTNLNDLDIIAKVSAEIAAVVSVIIKMMICKSQTLRLQILMDDMQEFLKHATKKDSAVIQYYVDRCVYFHGTILVFAILGPIAFILGPLVTSQPLPAYTAYPFSIDPFWIWALLYISQILTVTQVGCMAILDFMFAILLWFAGARAEILSLELEVANDSHEVVRCIQKHQELLQYIDILKATTRIMALEVSALALWIVTSGGFILIRKPPWFVLAKFAFFESVAALELFSYTWPADNLIEMGDRICFAAYGCSWIGRSPDMVKDIAIIMQRSRIPLQISINGFLPRLSLEFYGTVMLTSFSYLTTLRAMADP